LLILGLAALPGVAAAQLFPFQNDPNLMRCESVEGREVTCNIPDGRTATFERQESQASCVRGRTYEITATRITVTNGCRATFRLADLPPLSGSALDAQLRAQLSTELAARLRSDLQLSSTPSLAIVSDDRRVTSGDQVAYTGTVRASRSGKYWRTYGFDALYDVSERDFLSLTYREVTSTALPGPGSERTQVLRTALDNAMEAKLDADYPSASNPRFEILSDFERFISSTEVGYSGKGRINVDGTWRHVDFDSTYDTELGGLRNLAYHLSDAGAGNGSNGGGWNDDDSMDEDVADALSRALAAEVRRQKGEGHVQVAVNDRYERSTLSSGRFRYRGKFGYSFEDGSWVTRGYEATSNASGSTVTDLRIYKLKSK
jgi:hypothetical protein